MRPISLLSLISKILEKLLSWQLKSYLQANQLLSEYQSGFRTSHSTVTLLSDFTDFVRSCMDNGNYTATVLLDFSKAFNSINFQTLDYKLKQQFKFSDNACKLISSYLNERTQYVVTAKSRSSLLPLVTGVPQGSILGPIIFSLYINDISLLPLHCKHHIFADDIQIYCEINGTSQSSIEDNIALINNNLIMIKEWAEKNSLLLNASKSQAIIFGKRIDYSVFPSLYIDSCTIPFSHSVRNLGLIMSSDLSWDTHVDLICQKMYSSLRMLNNFRHCMPRKTKISLIRSLVLSHLFYCDIIFSDFNSSLTKKITRIYNGCIRFLHNLRLYDHISCFRNDIFGMSLINYHEYRVASFIFNLIHSYTAPSYIKKKFCFSHSYRTKILILTTHKTSSMDGSLLVRGAKIWNNIPINIREVESVKKFKKLCIEYYSHPEA